LTAADDVPLHNVWLGITVTAELGFTVIVKVSAVPVQSPVVGITVTTPADAVVPPLVAVNDAIFPVPLSGSPIVAFEFVQL